MSFSVQRFASTLAVLTALGGAASAAPPSRRPEAVATTGGDSIVPDRVTDDLTNQDRDVLSWATQLAADTAQTLEKWVSTGAISEEKLFARLYYPIAKTDPPKYTTEYSTLADRDFPAPQERVIKKSGAVVFAVITDINGYLPTHNQRYSQPLTGNLAFDLVNNRTKRIFGDRTGLAAARNEQPYLLQRYKRDTGELMVDLSVPVHVRGKHWGCVRIGYRQTEKP